MPEGDGALEVAMVWPERGIDLREQVDAAALLSAAEDSTELWPARTGAP